MNWLRRFMYGRYGTDQLNMFLLIVYTVLALISTLTRIALFSLIALILLGYITFRMFSRNINKRRKENEIFNKKIGFIFKRIKQRFNRLKDKNHRYFKCPKCKAILRVPKNRGTIVITCPKCKTQITKNT